MTKKKQNRVVAGQNKARQRAKRKARYSGPSAMPTGPSDPDISSTEELVEEVDRSVAPEASSEPVAAVPAATTQAKDAARRRRSTPALGVVAKPGLRSEVMRIGVVAAAVVCILVALEFGTSIGA